MRILLADDQPKVRFALRTVLERKLGFEVVGEAADVRDMWQQVEDECPDLLLLDWELPGPKVADLITALRALCPALRVIALSGHTEARQVALEAGVDAFVCKCDTPEKLLSAIENMGLPGTQPTSHEQPNPRGPNDRSASTRCVA
jgi:DNA-binding NarL/FixJ family response regulator